MSDTKGNRKLLFTVVVIGFIAIVYSQWRSTTEKDEAARPPAEPLKLTMGGRFGCGGGVDYGAVQQRAIR